MFLTGQSSGLAYGQLLTLFVERQLSSKLRGGNGSGTVGGLTSLHDRFQSAAAIRREISALLVWLAA